MKKLKLENLKGFDGKPLKEGDKVIGLKDVLMAYLRNAHAMGLTDKEQTTAYGLGFLIAQAKESVELPNDEYDVLKKLCDNGKVKAPNGQEQQLFGVIYKEQVRQMVNDAQPIKGENGTVN